MSARTMRQEASLPTHNNKLAQQLAGVHKDVTNIRKSLSEYRSKLSPDIESGFREFCALFEVRSRQCTIQSTRGRRPCH